PEEEEEEQEEEEEEYDEDEERPDEGPDDASLLISFSSHVAHALWNGLDRGILTLQNRYDRLSRWSIDNEVVLRILRLSGLYHLTDCIFQNLNVPLITAFVER
ncbi:hypothetical protein Dimus_023061, partial [Dionaea muscipula]